MDDLVKAINLLNATLRRQNHILLAAHNLNSLTEFQEVRTEKREDNTNV